MPWPRPRISTILCGVALGCVLAPFVLKGSADALVGTMLHGLRGMGAVGACGFVAAQFLVSATGILPASLLGAAAGLAYGFLWGTVLAVLGTTAGAVAGFHLGRRGLRNLRFLPKGLMRSLGRAEAFMIADGWKSVFLIRLSPIMPFAATSIALGASRLGERNYIIGTLASLPALLGYVYAGSLLGGQASLLSPEMHTLFIWALAIGSVAAVAAVARFVVHVRRAPGPPRQMIEP